MEKKILRKRKRNGEKGITGTGNSDWRWHVRKREPRTQVHGYFSAAPYREPLYYDDASHQSRSTRPMIKRTNHQHHGRRRATRRIPVVTKSRAFRPPRAVGIYNNTLHDYIL